MGILAVANVIPMRDRSAGWLRFYHILRILGSEYDVFLHPLDLQWQLKKYGSENVARYRSELEDLGVRISRGSWGELSHFLRTAPIEIAFFEHYTATTDVIDHVRFWHRDALVIIDSIDIAYQRLMSKAALTQEMHDVRVARSTRSAELSAYAKADTVIAVSSLDKDLLAAVLKNVRIELIPLIYPVRPLQEMRGDNSRKVVFIADFEHDANVDGILYFYHAVFPMVLTELPDARLCIFGPSPPEAVTRLAGPNVDVLGYVADIADAYQPGTVAIAPMRYGSGLKGKIAEAMSYGIPVVTNSECLKGFNLLAGRDVLVGDDPSSFARAIVRLFHDETLYRTLRESGWDFVQRELSEHVVASGLKALVNREVKYPAKGLPLHTRLAWNGRRLFEKHLGWRLARRGAVHTPE